MWHVVAVLFLYILFLVVQLPRQEWSYRRASEDDEEMDSDESLSDEGEVRMPEGESTHSSMKHVFTLLDAIGNKTSTVARPILLYIPTCLLRRP